MLDEEDRLAFSKRPEPRLNGALDRDEISMDNALLGLRARERKRVVWEVLERLAGEMREAARKEAASAPAPDPSPMPSAPPPNPSRPEQNYRTLSEIFSTMSPETFERVSRLATELAELDRRMKERADEPA